MSCEARCADCPNRSSVAVPGRGPTPCEILVVGMAPGKQELVQGEAFVGGSGNLLNHAFLRSRYAWNKVGAINVINCYPKGQNDVVTATQRDACQARFREDLRERRPQVVVPLGGDALRAVTGWHGTKNGISNWRGYVLRRVHFASVWEGFPDSVECVVPAYHPSFIMRGGNKAFDWLAGDINRAVRALRGELRLFEPPTVDTPIPGPELMEVASVDIETVRYTGEIERVGIAWTDKLSNTNGSSKPALSPGLSQRR